MSYFSKLDVKFKVLSVAKVIRPFITGDVLALSFRNRGLNYFFERICISIKKKKNFKSK